MIVFFLHMTSEKHLERMLYQQVQYALTQSSWHKWLVITDTNEPNSIIFYFLTFTFTVKAKF